VDNIAKLFGGEVKELVQVDSTLRKLPEGPFLLEFSSLLGVIFSVSHDCR